MVIVYLSSNSLILDFQRGINTTLRNFRPPKNLANHVRTLTLEFHCFMDLALDTYKDYLNFQLDWFKRFASGEFGFEN